MKVYIITDEKYGPMAVFGEEEKALVKMKENDYAILPSGHGDILEFDVEELPETDEDFD